MKVAFSTLACPAWTVEQAADAGRAHGYDGIEWRLADGDTLSPKTPPEVLRRIADASRTRSLDVVCLDTSCTFVHEDDEAREKAVRAGIRMARGAESVGAPLIRVFGGRLPAGAAHADVLEPAAAALGRVVEEARRIGVGVAVETHDDWASSAEVVRLARAAGAQVVWDVQHPFAAGEDPADTFDALAGSIAVVHMKDARPGNGRWLLTPLGEGELPLRRIVAMLEASGFEGYVSFEWEKRWHPELADPEEVLPGAAELLRGLAG